MEAINLLLNDKFVRVHRSFVVAAHKIDKAERHQITINHNKIPVGEAYRHNLKTILDH